MIKDEDRYKEILGKHFFDFKKSLEEDNPIRLALRVNAIKSDKEKVRKGLEKNGFSLEEIPWCNEGFFVENPEHGSPAKTLDYKLGHFFVQNASSMIPPLVLDPKEDDLVLDLTAAPGSKTTQMSALMNNKGLIMANDKSYGRIKALGANIQRMNCTNVIVTVNDGRHYPVAAKFDKILLDAPCSGTGGCEMHSINKAEGRIPSLQKLQLSLFERALNLLKDDGTLVYSTCSIEPEENEIILQRMIEKFGISIEPIKITGPFSDPLEEWQGETFDKQIQNAKRVLPINGNEGFFVAKIKKVVS